MEVKFIKSKILVVCTLLILLVSLSTVVASDVNDVVASTDDGNLTVQSTTNDMEIEQSNNDISNDEQSAGSDMLLASSNEKSYNDDGQDDVLMATSNEDVLGAGTFTHLSNLISGSGNNLTLADDYKHTDYYGTITINKNNWVLDGQGHVIDGNNINSYNIFKLNDANNITFKNIKFQNVDYQGSGGVIQFDNNSPGYISKEVTFENCTFTNCKAINGGVMAINKGIWNITIKNCVFDKYEAEFKGGAFFADNLQNKISCLNIYNSTFSNGIVNNNKQSANGGGAIFLYASCTGNIYSTKFINHTIKNNLHEGMAIRYSGVLNIDGCEFENNKGWDGAVCTGSDTSSATIKNSIFKNNHASRWGGALQIRNALIENCTFINNTAQNGGAIYSRFTIYIKDSKFEDNAATDGGAVNIEKRTTGSVIEGCNFTNNTASRGGAIFSDHAASNQIFSSKFNENKATSLGGAIYLDNEHPGTMEITTSEFVNNDAPAGGAIYDTGNSLKITSSNFVNNTANTTFAGAIYSNDLTIKTSDFIENTAKTYAGAVYAVNSLNIDESNFIKNYADAAGAVFTSYISATLTNFIENHARIAGAVEIDGSSTRTSTISDSEFRDNNATDNAGALYWNAAEAIITSTKFISNYAGNDAGAIFWNKGKGTVTRSEFKDNTALGSGGAIYWNAADGTVSSTTFEDNYAKYRGGAIYWHGNSGTVQISTFKRNSADAEGSVIYWYGNNGLVSGSTFSENPTLLGAVYHHGSNGKIIGNTFNQDKAVYFCGHSSATIENNKQNSSNLEDYSISSQGNISLINNEFTNAIHNFGNILTNTSVIVLDNQTIITDSKYYDIYTAVLDDNGNYIKLGNGLVNLYENTQQFNATFNNTHYIFHSPYLNLGTHPVSAIGNFTGLQSNVVKSGVLMYMILDINVTIVNYGEQLIITTTVVNTTENGTIKLVINEQVYDVPLENGTAVFVLHNAPPATYIIDAHYGVFNQTIDANVSCKIEARNSTLQIITNNITAGQDAIINIKVTNGTTGTVYVFVNNNMYILTLTNSTAQLNITNMPGGIYNIFATYNGDDIFKPSYNNTMLNVSKITPILPIIIRNNILVGETVVININATSNLTGTITVYVNGQEYVFTRAPVSFTLTNVTAGNYTVRVVYSGDDKYNAANNNTTFIVSKKNIVPTLTVEDITVGDNETIIVHVPTNANGIIFLTVNGANYYDYGKDGKATFVLNGLAKGTYNVTAIYLEDDIFYSNSTNASFKVDYVIIDPVITYTVDDDLDVTVNVTVPADANGDIIIEVNGTNYTAHIVKGKFSVDIPGLEGGIYPAKMYFANDTKYQPINKTFEIQLKKIDCHIHINASYIYVGENATIIVTVPNDAGGNVTIAVFNSNYNENFTKDVINGTAIFTVQDLVYGTYDVRAVFSGDRKYNGDDENARFNVRKVDPNPYSYISVADIFVGETATFNITMPTDLTGKVNLTVQNKTYTVNITDGFGQLNITGLKAGSPVPVHAYFAGNDKYLGCERNYTAFNVHKITNYPVDISAKINSSTVNNMTANITVQIPDDANGTGYIIIDNRTFDVNFTNGVANVVVDNLTNGKNYTVYAHFNGNDKYSPGEATKTLGGNKTLDYIFDVSAEDIFVGENVELIIYLPNATAGDNITVAVPGADQPKVTLELPSDFNGTYKFIVSNLAAGTYENCSVTYHGNSKYETSTRYGIISVSKRNVSPKINYNTTYVGQNLTVQITLQPDSSGNVSISINNKLYNGTVVNGTAYIVIPDLEAKTYNATLHYGGDEKYNARNQQFDVRVLRIYDYLFELGVVDIFVGDNETITIQLPSDIDVNVTVNIPGTDYINKSVQLTQGNVTIKIPGLKAGTYSVTASITNSSRYLDNSFTKTFTVSPNDDYYFKLDDVTTVFVRDNITFILYLPDDASGNVTVNIFGKNHTGEVKEGVAIINVTATQEGNFPFTISFEETGKYNYKSQNGYAFVTKKELNLTPRFKETVNVDEDVEFYFDSLEDATGNITITSRGVQYSGEIINGTATIVVKGYPLASAYSPAIYYAGDDKYYSSRGVVTINVVKVSDYEINVTVSNITVDDSEIVNITIPSDATEDVLISGNFSNNTFSVKVNKGNATFVINDLPAGNYTITVRYQGYQKYSDKNVTKTFEVRKVVPPIEIDFVNNNTIVVILPHLANGHANITVGGNTTQIEIINGRGSLDVSYLRPETYNVTATFLGGARYLQNTTSTQITIPKIEDYILPISAEDIIVGENSTITVILPGYADGSVNITIDNGNIIQVEIKEGKASYIATNMGVGTHNVTVSYANNEYVFKTNSTQFTVYKIKTIIDLTVDGNSTNLTVTARLTENVTGNVTIVIDSVEYPLYNITSNVIVLTVGAVPKEHDITVRYSGDENHTDASATTYIETIKESDYSINVTAINIITVKDNNIITVQLPVGATGNVHIYINGQPYMEPANPETGIVTLTLPTLASGYYNVTAVFSNTYYAEKENSTNFTVIKLNTTIAANVTNITKDLDEIINITLNESTSGDVEITIGGRTYLASIDDGFATLTLSNLDDGNYTAIITYRGNNLFNGNSTTVHFTVSKIPLNITITGPESIIVGQEADFIIETTRNITDMVTVKIGDKNYTAIVYNGKGNLIVTDLKDIGNYNVTVIYAGDNYYLPANNTTKINVTGKLPTTITVNVTKDNVVGEPVTIYINVTGDVNGTVYITLSGNPVPVKLENGTGNHTYYNLTARDYYFTVIYLESEYYLAKNATGDFTVSKKQSPISANVTNATVGAVEVINVNLPTGANGTVLLTINGSNYYSLLKDGLAQFNVTGLPVGNHTAYITYEGDDYYLSNQTEVNITTTKLTLTINITSESVIVVNNPVSFTIETSENITEVVMVKIINKDTQQEISNEHTFVEKGKGSYIVYGLAAGNYTAIVTFPGNTQYDSADNETNFTISGKSPTSLNVSVENITLGENATVYVNVTGALTGKVTLNIAGNPQTKDVVDGKVNFTVSGLIARDYHVTVTYLENDNYLNSTATTDFTVYRKASTIDMNVSNIKVGDHEIINVTVTPGATGIVLIDIAGVKVYAEINETTGIASATFDDLGVNTYNVTATYLGDNNYNGSSTNKTFNVTKLTTLIYITCNETYVVNHPIVFTITTTENITRVVTVNVDGKNYTSFIENGKGTYTVNNLNPGNYTATVYLLNDDKYDDVWNSAKFNVTGKAHVSLAVEVANITLGENATVYVNVTGALTGKVTLNIAGNPQTKDVVDGKVNFTVSGLIARDYHVTVTYIENDEYFEATATANFTVYRKNSTVSVNTSNIRVGDVETFNVTVTQGATGYVLISFSDVVLYVDINDTNVFSVPVADLPVGEYNVTITYSGDSNYLNSTGHSAFNISKRKTTVVIETQEVTITGHPILFNITTSANITEVITVKIGNNNYTTFVNEGKGTLTVTDIVGAGNYTAYVYFGGNAYYDAENNSTKFNISGKLPVSLTVEVDNITLGETAVIYVNVTGALTGKVTLNIAGVPETKDVVDGKVNFTRSGLNARDYHVTVTYLENNDYLEGTASTDFTVFRKDSPISANVTNATVGSIEYINVYLPQDATGTVLLTINGSNYYAVADGGVAKFNVTGLLVGNHTAYIKYEGDSNYLGNETEVNITTTMLSTTITITTDNVIVEGHPVVFTIETGAPLTEVITIKIGSEVYTTFVENGRGSYTVYDLAVGPQTAYVYFAGNTQYGKVENHTDFTIRGKSPSNITVKVDSITVDDVAVIYVNVTEGASGKVNIIVAGESHEIKLNNSKGNLTLPGLSARDYHVTAYYNGDDYYSNSTGTADFTVSKIPTSIRFEVSDINVGQKAIIKVILNETTDENITVHVNGVKYILSDYQTILEVPNLPEGTIVVTAEYAGNDRLTRAYNETTFKVTKNTTAIKIITHNITAGQKEIIELHLANDINGVVEVTVGNVSYAAVIKNGVAKLELENLASGAYNVSAIFYGDDRYLSSTGNASFTVRHETNFIFTANATVDNDANVVIGITLPEDVSGYVNVEIDGKNYTGLVVNGKGSATILNLPGKEYTGIVYFDGNDKYEADTTTVEFTINKITPNMRLDYASIYVGDNATITVYLPDAATGNVTISINNENHTEKVVNGSVQFVISDLGYGVYPFDIDYSGDGRYLAAEKSAELIVNKLSNHTIVITANDIHVKENATIYVTLPADATGNVTIVIDNRTFNTGELVDGKGYVTVPDLKEGTYEIFAEYIGDNKYEYIKDTAHMTVRKYENYLFNVTITNGTSVGQNATITVTLPDDVTNKVNITVDGITREVEVINGKANLTVNVTSGGLHPVVVTYPGDDKYESATIYTDLSSDKITNFPFSIQGDTIEVGQIAEVWYFDLLPDSCANASVRINVSGRNVFDMAINDNGSGFAPFPNLPIGVYNVTVTYTGNDKYASTVRHTTITVTKVSDYPMDVKVNEPNVGENLTIEIKLPSDAGGVVNVTVVTLEFGNKTYNVTVINGTANFTIPTDDLADGDYEAIIHYTGDDKYEEMTKTVPIDIVKIVDYVFDIESQDIYVGENETITIHLPNDVNTKLNITIGSNNYEIEIINGTGTTNITGLAHGSYDAEVTFVNSKYDKRIRHTSFKVSKVSDYEWSINYTEAIKVGENATIEVTVPEDAAGNVTLLINNKTFTGEIRMGKAIINATGLPEGSYQFTVKFVDDNEKYASDSKIGLVVVTKTDIELNPVYEDITVGEDAIINVTVPAGAKGNLTLLIDGRSFTEPISADGKVTFTVPDLDADNHTFIIGYDGDDKYNGDVYTGIIAVAKNDDYNWDFDVADIKVGQDEIINITLPDDATGGLIITVGDLSYHKAANGNTTYVISGLDNGTYNITIQYQGNLKYSNKTITKEFKVTKNIAPISINVINNTVIVSLPEDATGEVNITIGDKSELVPIIKGNATLDISDVMPNDYTVYATYNGDRKYFSNETDMFINIPKVDEYDMTVEIGNITVGENATVTVTLPKDATGNVNITVNNKTTEVPIINGTATLNVPELGIGDYEVFVNYTGNEKYNNNTASKTFNVKGQDVTPEVIVEGNNTVIVKLPENATGNVTITIGNETQTVKVENGTAIWNGTALDPGDYDVKVEYSGDDTYAPANATSSINIPKLASKVDLNVSDIMEGSIEVITVEVTPGATGIVLITIGDEGYYKELVDSKATFNIAGLTHGPHEATVTYYGDEKYLNSSASKPFYVGQKEIPVIVIDADSSIEIDNNLVFTVTTTSNSTNITVKVNGAEVSLVEGKYVFVANVAGEYNITAVVAENEYYASASNSTLFTVYKHAAEIVSITVPDTNLVSGQNAEIKVTMANNESGNVLIELGEINYTVPINGKVATLNVVLPVGDYVAKVYYSGDSKYNSTSGEGAGFSVVPPMEVEVGANDGNSTPITIKVPGNATGNVTVLVNGTPYTAKVENGTATINVVNATPGKQDIVINYTEDGKKPVVQNSTVDIPKVTNYPMVDNVNQSGRNATVVVTVPEDATGNVTLTINNQTYPGEIKDGKATFNVTDLPVGSYDGEISYGGDEKYDSKTIKTHIEVPIEVPSINAVDKLVRGWNSIYDYEAVFLDKFGNALEGVNVTFTIDGKTYTVLTEKHGVAKLTTSHLAIGEYNVTSYNPVTGETVTKALKVVPRLIENKDITMDFADGTYYTVLVIGDDGNPVGKGEIIDIYVNTIHYVSKTDKNGYAKLKLNLNPKTYKVVAEYKNYKVGNKLVIKQTLKLVKKTITIKKSAKKIVLSAKLKWSSGKAIKGKKIVFKFKGKQYKAKTNSKGIAKVTIKKNVIKKLKKGKSYKYSASYKTNKVNGKIKVKK